MASLKFVPKSLRKAIAETKVPKMPPVTTPAYSKKPPAIAHPLPSLDDELELGDESYVGAQTRRMRAAADVQEAEAKLRNLELGKHRGDLVQLKDVRSSIEGIHRTWVDALELLPNNVVRSLGPVGMDLKEKVRTAIDEELNKIREGLANGVLRKR